MVKVLISIMSEAHAIINSVWPIYYNLGRMWTLTFKSRDENFRTAKDTETKSETVRNFESPSTPSSIKISPKIWEMKRWIFLTTNMKKFSVFHIWISRFFD